LDWAEALGTGTIVSFSLVYRPNHPSFAGETPIVLAEVRLVEGVPLLARIVNVDPTAVRTGMRVVLVSLPLSARYPVPTFEPAAGA